MKSARKSVLGFSRFILDTLVFVFLLTLVSLTAYRAIGSAHAAEQEKTELEIRGDQVREGEVWQALPAPERIEPREEELPEVPPRVRDDNLSPAEEVELQELEMEKAEGKITETNYNLKKDTLVRGANLKF